MIFKIGCIQDKDIFSGGKILFYAISILLYKGFLCSTKDNNDIIVVVKGQCCN